MKEWVEGRAPSPVYQIEKYMHFKWIKDILSSRKMPNICKQNDLHPTVTSFRLIYIVCQTAVIEMLAKRLLAYISTSSTSSKIWQFPSFLKIQCRIDRRKSMPKLAWSVRPFLYNCDVWHTGSDYGHFAVFGLPQGHSVCLMLHGK